MSTLDLVMGASGTALPTLPWIVSLGNLASPPTQLIAYQSAYSSTLGKYVVGALTGKVLTTIDFKTYSAPTTSVAPYAVIWAGTQFVAVGSSGSINTSSDGTTWTSQTAVTSNILRGLAWTGSLLVAVGDSGTVQTSADGITWTLQTSGTTNNLLAVSWSGSLFTAVSSSGTIHTSSNGVTWTAQTSGTTNALYGVTWGNSLFVAVGVDGIRTSPDGVTWTSRASGTTYYAVAWSGMTFVVVGASGALATSSNGTSWTTQTSIGTNVNLRSLTWAGDRFVATSDNASYSAVLTSSSGVSWQLTFMGNRGATTAGYANGSFLVGGYGAIVQSSNLNTWNINTNVALVAASNRPIYGVTYAPWLSKYFSVSSSGQLYRAADGVEWTSVTSGAGSATIFCIANDGSKLIYVDGAGAIGTSTDGVTWTRTLSVAFPNQTCIAYGGGMWVIGCIDGSLRTSPDGVTWTTVSVGSSSAFNGACWTGTQFVLVGAGGQIYTSPDAVTWTSRTSGVSVTLNAVSATPGGYIYAVGASATALWSLDGITWTADNGTDTSVSYYGVAVSPTNVAVAGRQGTTRFFVAYK